MQIDSTVLSAVINTAALGDSTLIAAVAGKTIHIVDMILTVAAATTLTFKDGAAAISGPLFAPAGGAQFILHENPNSEWFATTNPANNFVLNSTVAVQLSGIVHYFLL